MHRVEIEAMFRTATDSNIRTVTRIAYMPRVPMKGETIEWGRSMPIRVTNVTFECDRDSNHFTARVQCVETCATAEAVNRIGLDFEDAWPKVKEV